jgi:hypothetical protein
LRIACDDDWFCFVFAYRRVLPSDACFCVLGIGTHATHTTNHNHTKRNGPFRAHLEARLWPHAPRDLGRDPFSHLALAHEPLELLLDRRHAAVEHVFFLLC